MGEPDVPLGPDDEAAWADTVELCDHCGIVLDEDDPGVLLGLLPASSAIHAVDPRLDGARMVQACSPACMERLKAQYAARRWRRREQWAGRVIRAVEARGGKAHIRDIAADTGLPSQGKFWVRRTWRGFAVASQRRKWRVLTPTWRHRWRVLSESGGRGRANVGRPVRAWRGLTVAVPRIR